MMDQLDVQIFLLVQRIRRETFFAKYRLGILTGKPTKEDYEAYNRSCGNHHQADHR